MKEIIKRFLNKVFAIKIKRNGNTELTIDDIYIRMLRDGKVNKKAKFLQIGANDGVMSDPIHKLIFRYGWQGYCVEPIKEYLAGLKQNRGNSCIYINKAIYKDDGVFLPIFKVIDEYVDEEWKQGIASFDKGHLLKYVSEDCIEQEEVETISMNSLIKEYGIQTLDLLIIDTEGYDYEIIKQFPFNQLQPKIIQFEHGRSAEIMSKKQLQELLHVLLNFNYLFHVNGYDVIAWQIND